MENIVTVAVVNFKTVWGDKTRNLNRLCDYAVAAARAGADIIALPELALTGYDDEPDKEKKQKIHCLLAETIPGPSSQRVAEIARQFGVYILFGMPERDTAYPSILYNAAAVCAPDGSIRSYRKMHMPLGEVSWAARGDAPLFLETSFGIVGVGICYDSYKFPELIRMTKAHGGQLFINITALPFEDIRPNVNREDLESLVLENSVYLASANLVGLDRVKHFMGGSSILGPGIQASQAVYYAGFPFGEERGQHPGIFLATLDLSWAAREYNRLDRLFGCAPGQERPGWRPEIYRALCWDVLDDPAWKAKVR